MERLGAWGAELASSLREALAALAAFVPGLILAAVLLVVGWVLARLIRSWSARAIARFDMLFVHGAARSADAAASLQQTAAKSVSTLLYWAVLLSFIAAALRSLGWPIVETWTQGLFAYVPVLVGGVLIILVGFIGGALAGDLTESAAAGMDIQNSRAIGRVVQAVVVTSGFVIGASELGLDVTFLIQLVTVVAGVSLAGVALAFALGTQEHLANLVATRYIRKHYGIGDRVRIGEVEGRILEISSGCVFLETAQGDASIPGSCFSKLILTKLGDEAQL